jgi:hypothetical protein
MIIIYNLIALGIALVALLVALVVGHFLGFSDPHRLLLIAAPIAAVLDLLYRGRTGRWFHPRGGGALFFVPIWCFGLLALPATAAMFLGPVGQLSKGTRSLAGLPSLSTFLPAPSAPNRITSEADGRREAVREYPSLAVANSPLNLEFVRRYRQYQHDRPEYFRNPAWPLSLAQECAAPLGLQPLAR